MPQLPSCILELSGQVIKSIEQQDDGSWKTTCRRDRRTAGRDRTHRRKCPIRRTTRREVLDVPLAGRRHVIDVELAQVVGPDGRHQMEHSDVVAPWSPVTRRMGRLISGMCRHMTISAVQRHTGLSWRRVKAIDQDFLEQTLPDMVPGDLRDIPYLGVDEVARAKGHDYMTVVYDMEQGHLIWVGVGRTAAVLSSFLEQLHPEAKASVKAVAMDMGPAYQSAVRKHLPDADMVFDRFHVMQGMSRAIDNQRRVEHRKADKDGKTLMKGTRFLLLRNADTLHARQQSRLRELLAHNENLCQLYILKEQLQTLWDADDFDAMSDDLLAWCECAEETNMAYLKTFAKSLRKNRIGICNYAKHPMTNARIEAGNVAIGMIRKRARGLLDNHYFQLKIRQSSLPDDTSMLFA